MKRKLLGITGIRSEYDATYPVYEAIRQHIDLNLELVVCGSHLSHQHGYSIKNIEKDQFKIVDTIDYLIDSRLGFDRVKGLGLLIIGLAQTVKRVKPDIIFVSGDREEPIAAALIGNYYNIPVAHLFGGDSAFSNADDPIRHGTSKLAHIHLVACKDHEQRLIKMGEENFRINLVGSPSLDRYLNTPTMTRSELAKVLDFNIISDPIVVLIQHPLSSEVDHSYEHMQITMEAIKELKIKTIAIYPNTDPGSREIINVLEEYRGLPYLKIFKNLDRMNFGNLLRHASCLIGNSSCGLLEAPFLKLPVINIGNRQKGRTNAGNVIFVRNNKQEIIDYSKKIIYNSNFKNELISKIDQFYFGDGKSGKKIAEILASINIDDKLLIKNNTY